MNSKFIRSFAVLSIATLLLGACGGSKGNNENSSENNPDNPVVPDGNFKLPTSLDEAKIFSFRDLELVSEEEQDGIFTEYLNGVNEVKALRQEHCLDPVTQEEWSERQEGGYTFFQDDFVEAEIDFEEELYVAGVHMAQRSSKQHAKMQSLSVESDVIAHYETDDLIDGEKYYAWEREGASSPYGQRFEMLFMLAMMTTNGYLGGVFNTEDAAYWVYVDSNIDVSSGTDYYGNTFYNQRMQKEQSLVEIKDGKISAATVYSELCIDHNPQTGELYKTPFVYERVLERYDIGYGEIAVSENKAAFLEKAPEWATSPDVDDTYVDAYGRMVNLNTNTGEISAVSDYRYLDCDCETHWIEGEKLQTETVIELNFEGTYDAVGLVISAGSVFYPITDLDSDSSVNVEESIVAQLAEALGSQAKVSTYDSVNYLVIDKDIKEIHLTTIVEYNDKALAKVVVSNVELVR